MLKKFFCKRVADQPGVNKLALGALVGSTRQPQGDRQPQGVRLLVPLGLFQN